MTFALVASAKPLQYQQMMEWLSLLVRAWQDAHTGVKVSFEPKELLAGGQGCGELRLAEWVYRFQNQHGAFLLIFHGLEQL